MAREVTVRMKLKAGAEGLEKFAQVGQILTGIKSGMEIAEKAGKALASVFEHTVGRALDFRAATDSGRQNLAEFATEVTKTQVALGDALLPAIEGWVEALKPVVIEARKWVEANSDLISSGLTEFLANTARLLVGGVTTGFVGTVAVVNGVRISLLSLKIAALEALGGFNALTMWAERNAAKLADAVGNDEGAIQSLLNLTKMQQVEIDLTAQIAEAKRKILKLDDDGATLVERVNSLNEKAIEIINHATEASEKAAQKRVKHTRIVSDAQKKAEDDARKAEEAELKAKAEQERADREYVEEQERIAKETEDRQNAMRIATAEADEQWRLARKNQEDRAAEENELRFQDELAAFQRMQDGKAKALEREKNVVREVAATAADLTKEFIANARGADGFAGAIDNLVSHIGEMLLSKGIDLIFSLITGGIGGAITGGGGGFSGILSLLTGGLFNTGGTVHAFAGGGTVPGFGLSDTVPALLTPGEVVVSRSGVRQASRGEMPNELGGGRRYGGVSSAPVKVSYVNSGVTAPTDADVENFVNRRLVPALRRARAAGRL